MARIFRVLGFLPARFSIVCIYYHAHHFHAKSPHLQPQQKGTVATVSAASLLEVLHLPSAPSCATRALEDQWQAFWMAVWTTIFPHCRKADWSFTCWAALNEVLSHLSEVFPQSLSIPNNRQPSPLASALSQTPHSSVNCQ